jgi:transketolase
VLLPPAADAAAWFVETARAAVSSGERLDAQAVELWMSLAPGDPAVAAAIDSVVDEPPGLAAYAREAARGLNGAVARRDEATAREIVTALETEVLRAYRPAHGLGRFEDDVAVALAMLAAYDAGADDAHLMMAEELMLGVIRREWTVRAQHGLGGACDAAIALMALAARTGKAEYQARALDVLREHALGYRDLGVGAAPYVAALQIVEALIKSSTMPVSTTSRVNALRNVATRLRIDSVRSTSEAGSGHPSTCASAAEIMAALFFAEMRYDPRDPGNPDNDRFVLSKGHAAPILYAAWAEAGIIRREDVLNLRKIDSDLEGHPTPRLPWVDVGTGSLGQGICAAVGIALNARRIGSEYRTYALLGDGEVAEGSVWEAAHAASHLALDNLCAIVDVNGLGQAGPTQWQHDMDAYAVKFRAFDWHVQVVDGHDVSAILGALEEARRAKGRPSAILARTVKGKGISFIEGKNGWHGKPLKKGEEMQRALDELETQFVEEDEPVAPPPAPPRAAGRAAAAATLEATSYKAGDQVATREAFGDALAKLGQKDSRILALDADVKNSTFTEKFEQRVGHDRFVQNFIAEQQMMGAAMGLAARGAIPFAATFAAFFTRAYDFVRMAAISGLNVKLAGSHAGVSIGEDGPSQMALEDLAMMRAQPNFAVLYPSDGVSTERLVERMAYHRGPVYMRTSRPKTPIIYGPGDAFEIGGLKVVRQSGNDAATVVGAGVTLFEALKAYDDLAAKGTVIRVVDLYSLQPIDAETLLRCARETGGRVITVEDHYAAGGIGDAVASAIAPGGFTVRRLAVREIPRSGKPEELMDRYGISAKQIVEAVRAAAGGA